MSSITREALCRVDACPEPTNPDWHQCIVDGNPVIEHAHILARSRRPDLKRAKTNIVALCHAHHQLQSDNKWTFFEESMPWGGLHQWLTDEHGNVKWKRDIGVSTAEGEARASVLEIIGADASDDSLSAAGAPATGVGPVPPGKDGDDALAYPRLSPSYNEAAGRIAGEVASPRPSTRAETSPCYSFHDNGIECESEITFEQAVEIALRAASEGRGRQWKTGDAVNIIERFGERAAQYVDVETFAYPEQTLSQMANVARIFPLEERRSLPWSYHQSVAKHEKRLKLLDNALAKGWDRATLREAAWGKKPKVKRWTISALRERTEGFLAVRATDDAPIREFFMLWLDWLSAEQDE